MVETIGIIASVLAVIGVVLNNGQRIGCFYLWWVSNLIFMGIHLHAAAVVGADTWSLAGRDFVFFVLAVWGWRCWKVKNQALHPKTKKCPYTGNYCLADESCEGCLHCERLKGAGNE